MSFRSIIIRPININNSRTAPSVFEKIKQASYLDGSVWWRELSGVAVVYSLDQVQVRRSTLFSSKMSATVQLV